MSAHAYLLDVLKHTDPLGKKLLRLFVDPSADKVISIGTTMTMLMKATSPKPYPEFEAVGCFTTLGYFRSIIENPAVKESGKLLFDYSKSSKGEKALKFVTATTKRGEFRYQAADPFVAGYERKTGTASFPKTIRFVMTPDLVTEFDGAIKVHQQAEKKQHFFELIYDEGRLKIVFGTAPNTIKIDVTEGLDIDDPKSKVTLALDTNEVRSVLKLAPKSGAKVEMTPKGAVFRFASDLNNYEYGVVGRKIVGAK